MSLLHDFIDLLFPKTCAACSEPLLKAEQIICTKCIIGLPRATIGFSNSQSLEARFKGKVNVTSVFGFLKYSKGGKVQELLHNLKYKNRQDVGVFMGKLFGKQLTDCKVKLEIDLLLAIPLHENKLILRGFNQSDLIASGIAEILNVPHETNVIFRKKATETQTKKSRIDRFENVDTVFGVQNSDIIKGKKIGLVDDVLTTGATLEVCVAALLEAGAKEVSIFALATAI